MRIQWKRRSNAFSFWNATSMSLFWILFLSNGPSLVPSIPSLLCHLAIGIGCKKMLINNSLKWQLNYYYIFPVMGKLWSSSNRWNTCVFLISANETELAFFCMDDYRSYKTNPVTTWWRPRKLKEKKFSTVNEKVYPEILKMYVNKHWDFYLQQCKTHCREDRGRLQTMTLLSDKANFTSWIVWFCFFYNKHTSMPSLYGLQIGIWM